MNYHFLTAQWEDFPPAHTTAYMLCLVMERVMQSTECCDAQLERKKSSMTFKLPQKPNRKDEKAIAMAMNEMIEDDRTVVVEMRHKNEMSDELVENLMDYDENGYTSWLRIGEDAVGPCTDRHVRSTGQIGKFEILNTHWDEKAHELRLRFKIIP